jgi:hypothetical protein
MPAFPTANLAARRRPTETLENPYQQDHGVRF